jgi:RNA polymerase sigma-B factor
VTARLGNTRGPETDQRPLGQLRLAASQRTQRAQRVDPTELLEKFVQYRTTRERALRNELVEAHIGLARHLAARYADRGEPFDDLLQVAQLGMVKAVERFDPERDIQFSTFASVTVSGELKRHFRDRTWSVRVPRAAQELHLRIAPTIEELTQRLGHAPRIDELAAELRVSEEELLVAMDVGRAYRARSIERPARDGTDDGEHDHAVLQHQLAQLDAGFAHAENRHIVTTLLDRLEPRERRIVELRFYEQRTQLEIGRELGISQMHVSRLLRRSLDVMRLAATA